jgi:aspartyl/asparaginyl-tRNA synthetase
MTTRLPPFNCDLTDDHDNSHSMDDRVLSVRRILAGKAPQDAPVTVKGWVRTRRDSKAGISFVHLSDGSSFHPVQVVAPNTLPNYADEVLKLTTGCAIEAMGMIVPSPAKGQPFEMQASAIKVIVSDPTEATFARVPARGGAPSAADERDCGNH